MTVFTRSAANPIVSRHSLPPGSGAADPSSVFNPGAVLVDDRTLLLLRVQTRARETLLVTAWSDDGVAFDVSAGIVSLEGIDRCPGTVYHVYDPRITATDDDYRIMVAVDLENDTRLGVIRTEDFRRFEFLGLDATPALRNGVLFPHRVDGRWWRLDRPTHKITAGVASGNEIVWSTSPDLLEWQPRAVVARGRPRRWDELIGPGPPPIRTREGWLLIYHGVATHFASVNIYQAGVMLLALDDPSRVLARGRNNVLEPRAPYELNGQVPNVVFPSGVIVDGVDSEGCARPEAEVRLYYGAADTCVGLATTTIDRLLAACHD